MTKLCDFKRNNPTVLAWLKMQEHEKLYNLKQSITLLHLLPSVLWRCWLDVRKSIRPVKTEWWGVGMVISLERMICLWTSWCHCHLIISCFVKIQNGLAFLAPAYTGCSGKEAVKWVSFSLSLSSLPVPIISNKCWMWVIAASQSQSQWVPEAKFSRYKTWSYLCSN